MIIYGCEMSNDSRFQHGLQLVIYHLRNNGFDANYVPFTKVDYSLKPRIWFCSFMWVMEYLNILRFFKKLKQHPLSKKRGETAPIFVAGGHGLHNPEPIADFFDVIVIGEGELVCPEIARIVRGNLSKRAKLEAISELEGCYVPILYDQPEYDDEETVYHNIPDIHKTHIDSIDINDGFFTAVPGVAGHSDIINIETARSCKGKCNFCSIAWTCGKYSETTPENIENILKNISDIRESNEKLKVTLSAPDSAGFKYSKEYADILESYGVRNRFGSVKFDTLKENLSLTESDPTMKVRIGIEGFSERLRKAMGKPISKEQFCEGMETLLDAGIFNFQFFMILGIPTEREEDYEEFRETMTEIASHPSNYTYSCNWLLTLTYTNFHVTPHTPYQWFPINYNHKSKQFVEDFKSTYFEYGVPKTWPSTNEGPFFIEQALALGNRKMTKFLLALYKYRSLFLKNLPTKDTIEAYKKLLTHSGYNYNILYKEKPINYKFPWDHIKQEIPKKVLVKRYKKMKKELE